MYSHRVCRKKVVNEFSRDDLDVSGVHRNVSVQIPAKYIEPRDILQRLTYEKLKNMSP
jgi:hypothetical protein